jgi:hypothetical protein
LRRARRIFIQALLVSTLIAPYLVGALRLALFAPFFVVSSAIAAYAFVSGSLRAKRIALMLASAALALTVFDLALRLLPVVPDDLVERWARLPSVTRYEPNLRYEGYRFNDLSRMAGVKEWREEKRVRIITDAAGFRNEQTEPARPFDVILLGDSFGAGAVTQEETWTSIWARDYGLSAYNLSAPASGPWQEYINLWAEKDRLTTSHDAILVWELFTANDLEDEYGSLEISALPWTSPARAWLNRINAARARSPVRFLLQRRSANDDVVAQTFLNGRKLLFYRPYIEAASRTPAEIAQHPHYASLLATIRALKKLCASRGLRLGVVIVPAKEEVYEWVLKGEPSWTTAPAASGFAIALAGVCAEENLPCLDLKPYLVRESRKVYEDSGQLLYWYDDTHMNAVGSRLAASMIYDELVHKAHPPD